MKHLLLTTIAAVVMVGCTTTQQPEPPTAKAPDISIHITAAKGNVEAVKQHLAAGTDVDAKDGGFGDATTPLHIATHLGHKEIAELLIAKGADVNAKVVSGPNQGSTPLDAANGTNHPKTVNLLRKHGGKTGEELKAAAD